MSSFEMSCWNFSDKITNVCLDRCHVTYLGEKYDVLEKRNFEDMTSKVHMLIEHLTLLLKRQVAL